MLKTRKKLFLMILISNMVLIAGIVFAYVDTSCYGLSCSDSGGDPPCVSANGYSGFSYSSGLITWTVFMSASHNGSTVALGSRNGTASSGDSFEILATASGNGSKITSPHSSSSYLHSTISRGIPYEYDTDSAYASCHRDSD